MCCFRTNVTGQESTLVAKILADKVHDYPNIHITLTSHSGGCGIAALVLEKLPDGVVIDNWVQMQSVLSPDYDLSKAPSHVRHAYSFYSELIRSSWEPERRRWAPSMA